MMGVYNKHTMHVCMHLLVWSALCAFTASGPGTLFAVQTHTDLTMLG